MTPREELLAAVTVLNGHIAEQFAGPETRIIRDWLQLEADQHWHVTEPRDVPVNKWDLVYKEEWVSMQPCIQMARLINGTGGT